MSKTTDAQANVLAVLMENPYGIQELASGLSTHHFPNFYDIADVVLNFKVEIKAKEFKGMDVAEASNDERALDLYKYADRDVFNTSVSILKKEYRKREINKIIHKAKNLDGDAEQIMDLSHDLVKISQDNVDESPAIVHPATTIFKQVMDGKPIGNKPMKTGLKFIDDLIGGFAIGQLYQIAARPGMGKTSLALQIAYNLAKNGEPGSIFSIEMTKEELTARMAIQISGVPLNKINEGKLSEQDKKRFVGALKELGELPIYIYDHPRYNLIDNLYGRSVIDSRKECIKWVVIDYIGLLSVSKKKVYGSSRNDMMTALSAKLMQLKKYGLSVISLSQLNREVEKRADKTPQISDLRDSGSLEQDADVILFPVRYGYYNMPDPDTGDYCEVLIAAKNRYGKAGKVKMSWEGRFTRFSDYNNKVSSQFPASNKIQPNTSEQVPF